MTQTEIQNRFPLSSNQQFLCLFDQGDDEGPFGPRYNIVYAARLTGEVDTATLQLALDDVVARHEALRTTVARGPDGGYQSVSEPSPVHLSVRELSGVDPSGRELRAEELIREVEEQPYSAVELPLLHAVLGRFDERDAVLVLVAHHTAADEWSMQLIMRDTAACYAARRSGAGPALAEPLQYRDYAVAEQERAASEAIVKSRDYWRENLRDARILAVPTDHRRSEGLPKTTAWHRFTVPGDVTSAVAAIARSRRSSPFMVLLAAYKAFLAKRYDTTDVVVMIFTSGRGQAGLHDTVGSFFNFVPLRTDLSGCATFGDVLDRVRRTCLQAYAHDIPFTEIMAQAPELMSTAATDDHTLCAFQVYRSPLPSDGDAGDFRHAVVRRRLLPQTSGNDIPDGAMWHLDLEFSGDMTGCLGFNTNLFDDSSMTALTDDFLRLLGNALAGADTPLDRL